MDYAVSDEKLENLPGYLDIPGLKWSHPFFLPVWLNTWWNSFRGDNEPYIRVVRDGDEVIGVAPMMRRGSTAWFMGKTDVCDYQDFIGREGREADFCAALLEDLAGNGIGELEMGHVRPDSLVRTWLLPAADKRGLAVETRQDNVSAEMDLPGNFDEYLSGLNKKQRHEVRRKVRRLNEEGTAVYRMVSVPEEVDRELDTFFRMFTESREDKAEFLTQDMETYFRKLAAALAGEGIIRIGVLELDGRPVAEVIGFDYGRTRYLYNSGYDPDYTGISAGLVSKVYTIRDAIERGLTMFDFLEGPEPYKYHLGGREVPVNYCKITF